MLGGRLVLRRSLPGVGDGYAPRTEGRQISAGCKRSAPGWQVEDASEDRQRVAEKAQPPHFLFDSIEFDALIY